MFKNLQIYRLPAPWAMTADQLASALASQAFTPPSSNELMRQGWASPRIGGDLVHVVGGQYLLQLQTEKKLLPTSVINQMAKARAAEMEDAQGFAPGKKAMKELKERVADELLPRAFNIQSVTQVWIDPKNGWLVVDATSASKADEVIKHLLKAVDRMPLESLRVQRSPVAVMTEWLHADQAPAGFTVDLDATLRATGESRAQVAYKRSLEVDDVRRHIANGKQCTRLAMTWDSKISFVLNEDLSIKQVKILDVLTEGQAPARDADERFDSDFTLMTGELAKLLVDVVEALGGEADDLVSAAQKDDGSPLAAARKFNKLLKDDGATATITFNGKSVELGASSEAVLPGDGSASDPLYDQAVAVVRTNQRASISLVQRYLRIGYNRAARLLEAMEGTVVGPLKSNGNRELISSSTDH